MTWRQEVIYLADLTGLAAELVAESLGADFGEKIAFTRQDTVAELKREADQAQRVLRAVAEMKAAVDDFDERFVPARLQMPDVAALEESAARIIRMSRLRKTIPRGARNWAPVVVAAGVARVFEKADLKLTIGERDTSAGRSPSTEYCRAVAHCLKLFRLPGDFRHAAEQGRKLRDSA